MKALEDIKNLIARISFSCFGTPVHFNALLDKKGGSRIYIQCTYTAPCIKSGEEKQWKGRKWYLSEHMTTDEIVKTCFVAAEAVVKHEIMENFKVDGITLFNPHVNYEELLRISHIEVSRS